MVGILKYDAMKECPVNQPIVTDSVGPVEDPLILLATSINVCVGGYGCG